MMIFPWFGKLNYKRISENFAIKRIFICGRPLPFMRVCYAMVWALPQGFIAKKIEGLSDEEHLVEVIDAITRQLKKENPDIEISGITIESRPTESAIQINSRRRRR